MDTLESSPFIWLAVDEAGSLVSGDLASLNGLLDGAGITDLVVMSHGWKNDRNDAAELYGSLWKNTCAERSKRNPGAAAQTVVAGVLWPSKAYRTDFDETVVGDVEATTTSSVAAGAVRADLSDDEFETLLADFAVSIDPAAAAATVEAARIASEGFTNPVSLNLVRAGARCEKGKLIERPDESGGDRQAA